MKRVNFLVARAIKDADYPQGHTKDIYILKAIKDGAKMFPYGVCVSSTYNFPIEYTADIPTYIEVWFWLCTFKKYKFELYYDVWFCCWKCKWKKYTMRGYNPEEAIIAMINKLEEDKLIK